MATATRMDGLAWAMLVGLALVWGLSFPFAEIALTELPVLTVVALRVALATVCLWGVVAVMRIALPTSRAAWLSLGAMGIVNNVIPFALIVWGQTAITSGMAAVLIGTTPLFTGFIAGALLPDERLTAPRVIGIVLGIAGVVVIVGPSVLDDLGGAVWAKVAVLGAALSYAFASVFARGLGRFALHPVLLSAGQTLSASLILVPAALIVDAPFTLPVPSGTVWAAVVAFAVLGTALAYILYFAIIARAGAMNAMLVTVLIPVVALMSGVLLLDETVTVFQLAGLGLIILGLSVIDGRLWRRRAPPARRAGGPAVKVEAPPRG
ncbi:DMT family transporter [Acuticoccus sp. I52.16.1]|uniref:DMT family transporter n=1 Tax=Acuticoccus sp. I52.16.1 TaxID=2928472 RepID=UPI001FD4D82C|nr:DMT family transporter [Acuticoccus sp. I52.16.1]UOM36313.1 DMT family transporter [Acuticoccus sp. I52.16.1]